MESNDIIKALEDWIKNYDGSYVNFKILGNTLDLITRQQAENENLKVENQSLRGAANSLKMHYEEAQAEVKRLKNAYKQCVWERDVFSEDIKQEIKKDCSYLMLDIKTVKSEAYKECIEKVKEKNRSVGILRQGDLDNIVKELEGEDNDK